MLLLAAALLWGLAWLRQDRLPGPSEIVPALSQAPLQTPLEARAFLFGYRRHNYQVKTFAEYELWGLIVSHNNISGVADIYHDADSLDTKDICVVWGASLARGDYLKARFSSGAWTCYYEYPEDAPLDAREVANNHLITDSDSLRRAINGLRRGDQVHIRGRLVGYRDTAFPDFWRNSSLTRADTGNGACEVVFVEGVEVLKPGNPRWRAAGRLAFWAVLALAALRAGLLLAELARPADGRLSAFRRGGR